MFITSLLNIEDRREGLETCSSALEGKTHRKREFFPWVENGDVCLWCWVRGEVSCVREMQQRPAV
jgi:hypothetical protein